MKHSRDIWSDTRGAERHQRLQFQLMAQIVIDPAKGMACAKRAGATASLFWETDLHAMWKAFDESAGDKPTMLLAAADELYRAGHWSSHAEKFGARYRWSLETLAHFGVAFAEDWSEFVGHCIAIDTRELARVHMQLHRAERLRRDALDAMDLAATAQRTRVHGKGKSAALEHRSQASRPWSGRRQAPQGTAYRKEDGPMLASR